MFKDDPPVVAVELGRLQPVELRVRPEVKRQDVLLKWNCLERSMKQLDSEGTGRGGGGQAVKMLAYYSDDPISNPADAYSFSVIFVLKRTKINKKGRGWHIFKK